jgi:hypothetical protein
MGGRKPTYVTSGNICINIKAVSVVPSGGYKTDIYRENMDVRLVGFHPLQKKPIAHK